MFCKFPVIKKAIDKGSKFSDPVKEVESTDGTYSVNLNGGDYTVEIDASGYGKEYSYLFVPNVGTELEKQFTVSPGLGDNEVRFVLEWGSEPADLDSHLNGVSSKGKNVNISFSNRSCEDGKDTIAKLDVDDTNGFGPETTTLYDTQGKYEYKIHRFSSNGSIATSGVSIKIYVGTDEPIVIYPPSNVSSEWWTVCKIKDGKIADIKELKSITQIYEVSEKAIVDDASYLPGNILN